MRTAAAMAAAIKSAEITAVEAVQGCIDQIKAREDAVQAWTFFDPDYALQQARVADSRQKSGAALGALHGVPVGIKDIFDTDDMPTENGTVLHAGRAPVADCDAVAMLREAGAVILGKTVTTELAVYSPGKTRNPHNAAHTPGGSSSGSAAAVAAGMVPLAIGSQTNGSVIRPASFCGVYGFKPTRGLISLKGALTQSPPLDSIGMFAGNIEDMALVSQVLMPRRAMAEALQEPPARPRIAFVKSPMWPRADAETQETFTDLARKLGLAEVILPPAFDQMIEIHAAIMLPDLAKNFAAEYERGRDKISTVLRGMIEDGQKRLAVAYNLALEQAVSYRESLAKVFADYDAILTPATIGTAPHGLNATGSPIFCTLWTLTGLPAISLPLLTGSNGLPLGVQLVGAAGDDARLLRTARWLEREARSFLHLSSGRGGKRES